MFGWQSNVESVLLSPPESRVSNIMPAVLVPATLQNGAECCPGRRLFKTKAQLNWDFGYFKLWYTKCDTCAQVLTFSPEFVIWNLGEKMKKSYHYKGRWSNTISHLFQFCFFAELGVLLVLNDCSRYSGERVSSQYNLRPQNMPLIYWLIYQINRN